MATHQLTMLLARIGPPRFDATIWLSDVRTRRGGDPHGGTEPGSPSGETLRALVIFLVKKMFSYLWTN